jgi:hypothetical protein
MTRSTTAVLATLILGLFGAASAADKTVEPARRSLTLGIGVTKELQLSTKEPIRQVQNEKDTVARVSPHPTDPTKVLVTGLAFGMTRITLIGVSGKTEIFGPK